MKYSLASLAFIASAAPAFCAAQLGSNYAGLYTVTALGSVSGVPTPYAGLVFQPGNPNVLLLAGNAIQPNGQIYAIPLTRDPKTHHVTAFGAPIVYATAYNVDAGLVFAPNGDLLFTEFDNNQIGQIKPGDTSADKTVNAPVPSSTGSMHIVPYGFPGAGNLLIDSYDASSFCVAPLTPDGSGTYDVGACSSSVTGTGGPVGLVHVPQGMAGFPYASILVAEYDNGAVAAYSTDQNGLPIIASRQTFLQVLAAPGAFGGPDGAAIDPVTGDFFFSTFDNDIPNQIYEVSLTSPGPAPAVTSVVNGFYGGPQLCPGLLANVYGAGFGSTSADVQVMVGGKNAPVTLLNTTVTPPQLGIEIPFELSAGATNMIVTVSGVPSAVFPLTLTAACPVVLTVNTAGSGTALVQTAPPGAQSTQVNAHSPAHVGDSVYVQAVGLGPTNPATPTGPPQASEPAATSPSVTLGGVNATGIAASLVVPGGNVRLGAALYPIYQIVFTIPPGVQGTVPLVVSTGGQSSQAGVTIDIAGISSVVNNASFQNPGTIAPGSIASVFANNLGSASTNEISGLFPATQSEAVQVNFNGAGGPLFHLLPGVSPQQIDLFIPSELPTSGTVNVQLTTSATTYPDYTLNMVPASPGFYRITDPKTATQYVIAQFANTAWLALPASTTSNLGLPACAAGTGKLVPCGQPASVGDYLVIYLTGLGLATPKGDPAGTPLKTGQNPPSDGSVLYQTPTLPVVTIGGIGANVLFSGLAPGYAGEYQIDVQIPPGVTPGDNVPLKVTMLGASDTTNISIQPGSVKPQ